MRFEFLPDNAVGNVAAPGPRRLESLSAQHRQVGAPRTHRIAVLPRHHAGHLGDVSQIVGNPGGEQLAQRHGAQVGVLPAKAKFNPHPETDWMRAHLDVPPAG